MAYGYGLPSAPVPPAPRPVDLDALASVALGSNEMFGEDVVVTRRWLRAVERDLRQGRAAMAKLSTIVQLDHVLEDIGDRA